MTATTSAARARGERRDPASSVLSPKPAPRAKAIAGAAPPRTVVSPLRMSWPLGRSAHGAPVCAAWESRIGIHGR